LHASTSSRDATRSGLFSPGTRSTTTLQCCLPIVSPFPSSPETPPRNTLTLSSFLVWPARVLYLVFRSSARWADTRLFCDEESFLDCRFIVYITVLARFATLGQRSAASLATGPLISVPLTSPFVVMITAALSSKFSFVSYVLL